MAEEGSKAAPQHSHYIEKNRFVKKLEGVPIMATNENSTLLRSAKEALHTINEKKENLSFLDAEVKKLEKTLKEEKKAANDLVKATIKKRQGELTASYDNEIGSLNEEIKRENTRRDKAIATGKKVRMKQETEELRNQVQQAGQDMRVLMQKDKLPGICGTRAFYSLVSPKGIEEYGILVLIVLGWCVLLPFLLTQILPWKGILPTIVVFVIFIGLFAAAFIMGNRLLRASHWEAIQKGRVYLDQISDKKRKIHAIEENIARDDNDSYYQLDEYNAVLQELSDKLSYATESKKAALDEFDRVTKNSIMGDVQIQKQGQIDELEECLAEKRSEFSGVNENVRKLELDFSEKYGTLIDRAFQQEEKIEKMIEFLENGEASTIMEAQNLLKTK